MSSTQTLTDHDAIREWAEARGATPARARGGSRTQLSFDFHQPGQRPSEDVKWDRWFDAFDRLGLALLVDHNTRGESRHYELVPRAADRPHTNAARRRRGASGGHQPVGVRAAVGSENGAAPGRRPLRKLVKAMNRRPDLTPATGTPGPKRRVKSRAVPKPIKAPRAPRG